MKSDIGPDWLAVAPQDVPSVTGIALTRVREAIANGELEVVYPSSKRQVVTREALRRWLAELPREHPERLR